MIAPGRLPAVIDDRAKWCPPCGEYHPMTAFGADRSRHDGLKPTCKRAVNARARALAGYMDGAVPERARVRLIHADPICRVLATLGPDFSATEWAARLESDVPAIVSRARWLGVRLGGA